MATDGSSPDEPSRGLFGAPALWAVLLAAVAQGAHLGSDAGLSPFAAIAYVGLLAPALFLAAIALGAVANALVAHGWVSTSAKRNRERLVAWAWGDDTPRLARRTAGLIAACDAVAAFAVMSWLAGGTILETVARPEMGLALLVGLQLVLALLSVALFGVLLRPLTWLFLRFDRRALVAPASVTAILVLLGIAATIAVRAGTDVGAHLPWDLATAVAFGALGWTAARALRRPMALIAIGTVLLVASFLVTVFMPVAVRPDRAIFTDEGPLAVALYRPLHAALDRDDDGAIDLYGGGDCAPDDPAVFPDAVEVLNNGIDEDCSGADFTADLDFDEAAQSYGKPRELKGRPNIVLITTDSLSMDRTSLGREDRDTTPHLAAWARRKGIVYDAAFAIGPSTRLAFPGIMASQFNSMVAMVKTKRHPYDWSPTTPTIARALASSGYRTVRVSPDRYFSSRWKHGPSIGFDVHDDSPTKKPVDRVHTAPEVTAAAIAQLEVRGDKRPLFLWVHYYDHHSPFRRPTDSVDYGSAVADVFDSEVEFADRHWGQLLTAIDRIATPTVVIFTSDHGESFDRYHPKKHHGHDLRTPVLHVPFIIAGPATAHRRVPGLVSHADIAPTIADLVGLERDAGWVGESLAPTLWGGADPQKSVVFGLFYLPERRPNAFGKISARTKDWYYERNLTDGAERLTQWRTDASGESDLVDKQLETAAVLRQVALRKLDALKQTERGLPAGE